MPGRLTRRAALQCALAWGLGSLSGMPQAGQARQPAQWLVSWYHGTQAWAGLWQDGRILRRTPLPARAHQLLELPPTRRTGPRMALAVARRPGEYLLRWNPATGRVQHHHAMEDDRFLAGHAVYSPELETLFTTETDAASGQGLVVARDPRSLQRRFEWASGGVGPHALLWEPPRAGQPRPTLLVANGGILNLPETGRRKLNLGAMDSNLTRLDAFTGDILGQWRLGDPHLSLRHLARAQDGTVGIALQAEHPDRTVRPQAPALALLDTQGLRALPAPTGEAAAHWDGYAGDIACTGDTFWVTAPQAGCLMAWRSNGSAARTTPLEGVCPVGVADGEVWALGTRAFQHGIRQAATERTQWDNHLLHWV